MKAQDLRLGNLVLFRGKICKVTTLSGDIIRVSEPEVGIIEQAYAKSPIELTPEVLGWCGFKKAMNGLFCKTIGMVYALRLRPSEDGVYSLEDLGQLIPNIAIEYLHQLQNLYYSLTGEELTISLPTVKLEEK